MTIRSKRSRARTSFSPARPAPGCDPRHIPPWGLPIARSETRKNLGNAWRRRSGRARNCRVRPLGTGLVSARSLALEFAKHFGGEGLQLGAMLHPRRRIVGVDPDARR